MKQFRSSVYSRLLELVSGNVVSFLLENVEYFQRGTSRVQRVKYDLQAARYLIANIIAVILRSISNPTEA